MQKLQDLHVATTQALIAPRVLKEQLPVSEAIADNVANARAVIRSIITGRDPRLLCIVGPCSIHDPEAAMDYAKRLARLAGTLTQSLYIVMRVYFEKPRTTIGWKGLINDPRMDGSYDLEHGLRLARKLLVDINQLKMPAATELLDPITPQYIADLISWTAIGARTTESQTHREMASGLSMPVGFKNSTDGNLQNAINAIDSARRPHSFLGINQEGVTAIVRTTGNPDVHVVLRGGSKAPNYDEASIRNCEWLLIKAGLDARVIVDCSHAQTNKDYTKQPAVLAALVEQIRAGNRSIMGVMLESNLGAGNQPLSNGRSGLKYGISITDPCIDWATTERCLVEAANALSRRR
ncbi:MAG TPA: 3-deoxy-7-phosphoheptulonate synthase [Candidatus Binataceae bacterium]|nr:3-deoxy-7-phosphoheptulonate synthase [Candidatus Binataceae bacterium]